MLWSSIPFPSCPAELVPQHLAPPPLVNAHVFPPPALTAASPELNPVTSPGSLEMSVGRAFPSCPAELLPQHLAPPPLVNAHVWPPLLALIALNPEPNPNTSTGTSESGVKPVPSW